MIMFRKTPSARFSVLITLVLGALMTACGGGGGNSPPPQILPPPPPPPPPVVSTIDVDFSAADVVAGSQEAGTATGSVDYNETDDRISAAVTLSGITADAVSIRLGAAGATGDERFTLVQGASPEEWTLAETPLAGGDALQAGGLYVLVTTAAAPDGALRGQILPDGVSVDRVSLESRQVSAGSSSAATGTAWLTVEANAGLLTVHAVTSGLDDADTATMRDALAGDNGPILETLAQDPADPSHWLLESAPYTQAVQTAVNRGAAYLEFTTPGAPNGALRGQVIPDTYELIVTALEDDGVVMVGSPQASAARLATVGRTMTTVGPDTLTSHTNLFGIANANAARLRRAPAGQNGPSIADYQQDINDPLHWMLEDVPIDAALEAGLSGQTLYIEVTTAASPGGIARGQIVSAASMEPPDDSAFVVTQISPANAAVLDAFPSTIVATLNRAPLDTAISAASVAVEASGLDGSFGDGNETSLTPASVSANGNDVLIDMSGVTTVDDIYRVQLLGDGANGIIDVSGIPFDGDADGVPGGTFESAFEVETPPAPAATFAEIQNTIFTPTCATAGCHSGSNPPDGLNLTAGIAYGDIVNVASVQMPALLLIEPGDPDDSYLVRKIQGTGIVANRMPLGGAPLSQEAINLVRQWVAEGAANN